MDVYARLNQLGIALPEPPGPGGLYTPVVEFSNDLCYMSGCGPAASLWQKPGKLGQELTTAEGQQAARAVALNMLAVLHRELGDLNRVKRIVKLLGFVSSAPDFYEQPQVMNGASQLFIEVFGDVNGRAARSAIGAPALPGNIPVEVEAIIQISH